MTEETEGLINVKKIPGAILLSVVLLVAVFSVSGGGGPEAQMFQSGFVDISLAAGATGGASTITFNPAFTQSPTVALTIKPTTFGSEFESEKVFFLNPTGTTFSVTTALTQVGSLAAGNPGNSPEPLVASLYLETGTISTANEVDIYIQSFDCTVNAFENASSDGTGPIAFTNADANSLVNGNAITGLTMFNFNTTLWNIIVANNCSGTPGEAPGTMSFRLMMRTVSGINSVVLKRVALLETYDIPAESAFITLLSSTQLQIEAVSPASPTSQTIRVYWIAYVCLDGSSVC